MYSFVWLSTEFPRFNAKNKKLRKQNDFNRLGAVFPVERRKEEEIKQKLNKLKLVKKCSAFRF